MDTHTRKFIWEVLKGYRSEKILILTTHYMDEADFLADRIAIMSQGRIKALGT
jgi:ATP-binding cassette subfamily A (ABC1) protein 3